MSIGVYWFWWFVLMLVVNYVILRFVWLTWVLILVYSLALSILITENRHRGGTTR